MTAGIVNVYIPLRHDNGERSTGLVPKGQRARTAFTRSVETRPFFDPGATRNPSNAIPVRDARPPLHPRNVAKRGPLVMVAPRGWSLRPGSTVGAPSPTPTIAVELRPEHCGKSFRTPNGYAWHLANVHPGIAA